MLRRFKNKKQNPAQVDNRTKAQDIKLNKSLDHNIEVFKSIFKGDDTLMIRQFSNRKENGVKCCLMFVDGMVNNKLINDNIIEPIMRTDLLKSGDKAIDILYNQVIASNIVNKTYDIDKQTEAILEGNSLLLLDGSEEALIITTKGWEARAVERPESENVLRGPREGFTESLMVNLSLIRRRLKTSDLKFSFKTVGERSHTKACICYIDGLVNEKIIQELVKRLDDVRIDGVMDSGYIQELIKDSPYSPFKTIGNTERPDVVAAKMLEGRIALVLDGTPFVLTLPYVFIEYFQANEDYYDNFYFSSINRIIRILGFLITTSVPVIYVALVTYHQEIIPTPLLLSISSSRQGVPFPSIVEVMALIFVFETLREAGTRMPTAIGQAVSIVGALVLGQAAVEAKLVSAPMVIVVALTGITGLLIPKMKSASISIRFVFLLLGAFLGLYGYAYGVIGLLIHLFGMRSFGVPYMVNLGSYNPQDLKDTVIRAPWWYMRYRPKFSAKSDYKRKASAKKRGVK